MNTLWPMGEGTVREIRDRLAERLPRAYTTIMTIMDRLARKGVVERRKVRPRLRLSPESERRRSARAGARAVCENFFGGSKEALLAQLADRTARLRCCCRAGASDFARLAAAPRRSDGRRPRVPGSQASSRDAAGQDAGADRCRWLPGQRNVSLKSKFATSPFARRRSSRPWRASPTPFFAA